VSRLLRVTVPEPLYYEIHWWAQSLGLEPEEAARCLLAAGVAALDTVAKTQPQETK
jgi:hypothetical protein